MSFIDYIVKRTVDNPDINIVVMVVSHDATEEDKQRTSIITNIFNALKLVPGGLSHLHAFGGTPTHFIMKSKSSIRLLSSPSYREGEIDSIFINDQDATPWVLNVIAAKFNVDGVKVFMYNGSNLSYKQVAT